ncbi:MAG: hypothetical protein FD143_3723 [Ignavibacteria bacterium]|nr:MAG: hypothetical protein FD143_3723 [Ignavibacteria bacterium]
MKAVTNQWTGFGTFLKPINKGYHGWGCWLNRVNNSYPGFGVNYKVLPEMKINAPRPPQKMIHLSPLPQGPEHLEVVLRQEQLMKEWSAAAKKKKLLDNLKKKKKQTKFAPAYHYNSIITNF